VLAGDLAHEVRNPLVAVKSFLELLAERGADPELARSFLPVAVAELRRAERLLDAMVDPRRVGEAGGEAGEKGSGHGGGTPVRMEGGEANQGSQASSGHFGRRTLR
jgi:signal transduction histidine kinase